jgi:hypothetical protein
MLDQFIGVNRFDSYLLIGVAFVIFKVKIACHFLKLTAPKLSRGEVNIFVFFSFKIRYLLSSSLIQACDPQSILPFRFFFKFVT